MGFFEPPPPPPPPEQPPVPEWMRGPPDNVLPGPLPLSVVVARSDDAVVALRCLLAFPRGFELHVGVHLRADDGLTFPFALHEQRRAPDGTLPDELLRFGVQYVDGRRATSLDRQWARADGPPELVLRPHGGGGGQGRYDAGFWVWPLPSHGAVTFVAEWPSQRIAESRTEIDSAPILEAAARAEELWPAATPGT